MDVPGMEVAKLQMKQANSISSGKINSYPFYFILYFEIVFYFH
jgi:hypothetical protein